jgi:hypothetical protein
MSYRLVNRTCDYQYSEANQEAVDMQGDLTTATQLCRLAKISPVIKHVLLLMIDKDTRVLPNTHQFCLFGDEFPGMCLNKSVKPRQLS